MSKILCLGNNNYATNDRVSLLAENEQTVNHGLVTDPDITIHDGYYHTTVLDMSGGDIIKLANKFTKIVLLDQPREQWSHWKPLLSTYKIMLELEKEGHSVDYINNKNIKPFNTFYKLVHGDNPSFCIYPFILLTEDRGHVHLCARSTDAKVAENVSVVNFKTNPEFQKIRTKMIAGEKLLDHCTTCYDYEDKGIESSRQFETMDWVSKLGLESLDDLKKIEHPKYYEIRLSNKCNIMCRSCRPEHSHLIEKEYKIHNIQHPQPQKYNYTNFDHVHLDSLDKNTRIYLTGGEPSVMPEFYDFMEKCIGLGKTDFDFTIGTNGVSYTPKFLRLVDHFSNMNFSISVDGYGKFNDYQRWLSNFDGMMENAKLLQSKGHNITFLVVPGIYNVTNLHLLYEYFDKEWQSPGLYVQINHNPLQSAYNHPNPKLVVESMKKCQQTKTYHSDGRSCKTTVDSLLEYYSNSPRLDTKLLKQFFDYNDKLDQARNVKLIDYFPELDAGRKYIS